MRLWIRNTAYFLENFRICDLGLRHQGKLRICDLQINNNKFAMSTSKKFADFRLQNEPKNLRICDLRTNENNVRECPTFVLSLSAWR